MSAWIGTEQYAEYFNHPSSDLQGGVSAHLPQFIAARLQTDIREDHGLHVRWFVRWRPRSWIPFR